MSPNNIGFYAEIRKMFRGYPFLSGAMLSESKQGYTWRFFFFFYKFCVLNFTSQQFN